VCEFITRPTTISWPGWKGYSDGHHKLIKEKNMLHYLLLPLALLAAGVAGAAEVAKLGDLEMHSVAVPSSELTPDAAKDYNITPAPGRGLLTVTLIKKGRGGKAESVPGQVYAGAVSQDNKLFSIPIREVRQADGVYYLGEYRVNAPDTLRFLVNANVLGKPLKAEFTRAFSQ
jgi:hypothetical protein